ncbi:MAG: DMT family transporter [Thermodesulfobacteriota bacterium]
MSTASRAILLRTHLLMLLAAALVSTSFTVAAWSAHRMDPLLLTLCRFLLATLCFAPIACRHGLVLPAARQLAGYAAISFCLTGFFWLMFFSLRYTSALNTSAIYTLVPGLSGIYGLFLLREKLGGHRLLALLFGMVGALWIIFRGDFARLLALDLNRGDILFFCGCLLMALYTPLVKLLHRKEPMSVMTFWIMATGCGWLLLFAVPRVPSTPWSTIPPSVWAAIAYLAVFTTIVTFYLSQHATLIIGPTRVMAYSYFYPAMVPLIEWALGHGLPPEATYPGIAIVLAATVVLQRPE